MKRKLFGRKKLKEYSFGNIKFEEIKNIEDKKKLKEKIKQKVMKKNKIDYQKIRELKENLVFELEIAEREKEESLSVNIACVSLPAGALIGLIGGICTGKIGFFIFVSYAIFVMGVLALQGSTILKERRNRIFFLKIFSDILDEIEAEGKRTH